MLAVLFLWGGALLLLGLGLLEGFSSGSSNQNLTMFMTAVVSICSGFLVLPSAIFSLLRILGKPAPSISIPSWLGNPYGWLFLFLAVIWLGSLVAVTDYAWLFLPGLHVLGIGLPVMWILFLAVRNLPLGSYQRRWGVFASGLTLGPGLILILEAIALIFLLIILGVWLSGQPELVEQLGSLSEWATTPDLTIEDLLELFAPIALTPWALIITLLFAAVIVPLIEEFFKPIGVWLLFGRKLTPSAGFAAGAISGAGYALFESLVLTMGGEAWVAVVMARVGTAAVHIFTSAVTGWALVQAWQTRRILRLLAAYTFGVVFHGLWNALAILSLFASLRIYSDQADDWLSILEPAVYAPYVVGFLALVSLIVLISLNRYFAKESALAMQHKALSAKPSSL